MNKEVTISKPERARKSIRSESVWKAAKSLKAHGKIRNFQSTVESHNVCRVFTKCTVSESTSPFTEVGCRGILRE